MQTDEIQKFIRGTGAQVCACDQLPLHRIKSGIFISNTELLKESGGHWVLLAVRNSPERKIIFFDSLAVPPFIEHFYKFLKCNVEGGTLELNKNVIQDAESDHCGKYCVLLVFYLLRGGALEGFCKEYSSSPLNNDKKLEREWALFVEKWYKSESAAKKP